MTRVEPAAKVPAKDAKQEAVREVVGMRKWLRLTARKHSSAKQSNNDAAQAAADALAMMLKDARKLG
jgi:hypothetical protein